MHNMPLENLFNEEL